MADSRALLPQAIANLRRHATDKDEADWEIVEADVRLLQSDLEAARDQSAKRGEQVEALKAAAVAVVDTSDSYTASPELRALAALVKP